LLYYTQPHYYLEVKYDTARLGAHLFDGRFFRDQLYHDLPGQTPMEEAKKE
jgi:hypothetical protein